MQADRRSQREALQVAALPIERLKELVESGAGAHNVNLKYMPTGGVTARLAALHRTLVLGSAWHAKSVEVLSKPQGAGVLKQLLLEGELRLANGPWHLRQHYHTASARGTCQRLASTLPAEMLSPAAAYADGL